MTPKNVRARRMALGMTTSELAEEFGISPSALREFELGASPLADAEKYRPILDRLEQERLREHN